MNANFLNALKTEADKVQSKIKKTSTREIKSSYNPERETACTVIDSNFGTIDQTIYEDATVTNVERIVNRNRIDVYFDKKPSEKIRSGLKDNGFRFNPDTKAWYNKDCLQACAYLTTCLNVQGLDISDNFKNETTTPEKSESTPINKPCPPDFENDSFREYVRKVNALNAHLGIDSADLCIKAIDCLYNETFKH